ncbi:hypothetical protein J5N97_023761 [Dioscorea zingiberensis]|uniref:RING-type E3 ubiquitin transferase n=1 Tax=Dioscorea zingiberensis TaxID=325984 RepID=A0A9D5H858_9LILI|nr:hypothetical protein J5N97_023761 [Dioscorea zingiberensis]
MASAGAPLSATVSDSDSGTKHFFCHQCNDAISFTPAPGAELACPFCFGGFIEEYVPPSNPSPNPESSTSSSLSDYPLLFPGSFDLRQFSDLEGILGLDSNPRGTGAGGPEPFNPLVFLQNYLNSLMAGGANIRFILESDRPTGASLGDYFIGPGLEDFIEQLTENDPNRYDDPDYEEQKESSPPAPPTQGNSTVRGLSGVASENRNSPSQFTVEPLVARMTVPGGTAISGLNTVRRTWTKNNWRMKSPANTTISRPPECPPLIYLWFYILR